VAGSDDRLAVSASGGDAVAALFPPPEDVTSDDVAAHEEAVMALLAGETEAGRRERAALEAESGPLGDIEAIGTLVEDGELRTYLTIGTGPGPVTAWYALGDEGGIAGADFEVDPPTLLLGVSDGGGYRPDDPAGTGPDVTVEFTEDGMTISGPAGTTSARRAG
jgi:hypothetical protein